jgi:hypothetical protein
MGGMANGNYPNLTSAQKSQAQQLYTTLASDMNNMNYATLTGAQATQIAADCRQALSLAISAGTFPAPGTPSVAAARQLIQTEFILANAPALANGTISNKAYLTAYKTADSALERTLESGGMPASKMVSTIQTYLAANPIAGTLAKVAPATTGTAPAAPSSSGIAATVDKSAAIEAVIAASQQAVEEAHAKLSADSRAHASADVVRSDKVALQAARNAERNAIMDILVASRGTQAIVPSVGQAADPRDVYIAPPSGE